MTINRPSLRDISAKYNAAMHLADEAFDNARDIAEEFWDNDLDRYITLMGDAERIWDTAKEAADTAFFDDVEKAENGG